MRKTSVKARSKFYRSTENDGFVGIVEDMHISFGRFELLRNFSAADFIRFFVFYLYINTLGYLAH